MWASYQSLQLCKGLHPTQAIAVMSTPHCLDLHTCELFAIMSSLAHFLPLTQPFHHLLADHCSYKLLGRAYPYMARRLLTDPAPELRASFEDLIMQVGSRGLYSCLPCVTLVLCCGNLKSCARPSVPCPS
jgi:hypothetical protein